MCVVWCGVDVRLRAGVGVRVCDGSDRVRAGLEGLCVVNVSKRPNRACSERSCIEVYRKGQIARACIVMYRNIRFGPMYRIHGRGARLIHAFGIGEIHGIHARYNGQKNGGEARHNTCRKEESTERYTHRGKIRPYIGGKSPGSLSVGCGNVYVEPVG